MICQFKTKTENQTMKTRWRYDSSQMYPYVCVFPHSCHSTLICILIPAYMALSPSCLGLWPPVPRRLCLLSLSSCLDLPPVSLSLQRDGLVCPLKLQTLSLADREKGSSDQEREREREREHTGAPEIDKHQLAGNTNPSNPFKIFTSVPPATATLCQRKNQGTGENCGELSEPERPRA